MTGIDYGNWKFEQAHQAKRARLRGGFEHMFERFTDRSRRVVVLAQDEARRLHHNYIGTEHLLLALIGEGEGVAAKALEARGVSLEKTRQQVEELMGEGREEPPSGHIPFTPRAKKVLELSLREALQLGHNYIGTEHILLGLIREGEGVACQILAKMAGNLATVRREVLRVLGSYSPGPKQPEAVIPPEALARAQQIEQELHPGETGVSVTVPLAELRELNRFKITWELAFGPLPDDHILHRISRFLDS